MNVPCLVESINKFLNKMDDNKDQAINETEVETDVEMPSTETETTVEEGEKPEQLETDVENKTEVKEESKEHKPTRFERNFQKVLEKNRKLKEENEQIRDTYSFLNPSASEESIFTEEDIANQSFDPKAVDERVNKKIVSEVNKVLAFEKQRQSYEQLIERHNNELDEVVKSYPQLEDPEIQQAFVEMYEDINYQGNQFVGRKSPTELAKRLFGTAEKLATKKAGEMAQKVVKQMGESAVLPDGSDGLSRNGSLEEAYNTALESGSDDAWADYFKKLNSRK